MFTPQELEEIRKADRGPGRPRLTPEQKAASEERRRAWHRTYYLAHREEILAKRKEHKVILSPEEREKKNTYSRKYYKVNRELYAERNKKYYAENRDILIARQMQYYWAKKEAARLLAQTERQKENTQGQYSTIGGNCQCG